MLNSFVHIVMYFYYMVAAMGPQYQKFIWWKKYLTTFQMVSEEDPLTGGSLAVFFFVWLLLLHHVLNVLVFVGSIRCHLHASIPIAVARVRLPEGVHGVDRSARHHVPVSV